MDLESFMAQFTFQPEYAGHVGVECEGFVMRAGKIVPKSDAILAGIRGSPISPDFGPELSRCQIEWRTPPNPLAHLGHAMQVRKALLDERARQLGLHIGYFELAPQDIPLSIYPEKRYQDIAAKLDVETLRSGCRVAGIHVHVGMRDRDRALRVYNHVRTHVDELVELGDGSQGERMRLYKKMTPRWRPPELRSWSEVHAYAEAQGWERDPRSWWSLIRISRYGTIEFRPFGSTESLDCVYGWAERCHVLCNEVS